MAQALTNPHRLRLQHCCRVVGVPLRARHPCEYRIMGRPRSRGPSGAAVLGKPVQRSIWGLRQRLFQQLVPAG